MDPFYGEDVSMTEILEDITVLDLTQNVAGPYCTQVLGDLGAEVIKIERPDRGDDTRSWTPPLWDEEPAMFLSLNRNKKSLSVNLNHSDGRAIIRRLAAQSDVLVESFRQGSLSRRDLDYDSLKEVNDRLVYCSLSGFGDRGPHAERPGYDPLIQAYTGLMSVTGEPGRPPVREGASIMDMGTGLWCVIGILSALRERRETGEGKKVRSSLYETGLAWMHYYIAFYLGAGKVTEKLGSTTAMIAPYEAFETKDDYIFVSAGNDRLVRKLCDGLGLEDLTEDPRFESNEKRVTNRWALHDRLEERFQEETTEVWVDRLNDKGIPCSPIQTIDEVVVDPQLEALDMLTDVPHSRIEDLKLVDLPVEIDSSRADIRRGPPDLNADCTEILSEVGYGEQAIQELKDDGAIGTGGGASHEDV